MRALMSRVNCKPPNGPRISCGDFAIASYRPQTGPNGRYCRLAQPLSSAYPPLDSSDHLHIRSDIGLVSKLGGVPLKPVE